MRKRIASIALILVMAAGMAAQSRPEADVRQVVDRFEQGLRERKLESIEKVVADDIVVFENGGRNNGWVDFRDHHLVPEMKEPALPSTTAFVRSSVKGDMAWAYTKTTINTVRRGAKTEVVIWSAYVLERRNGAWKIVMLDWSVGHHPAG